MGINIGPFQGAFFHIDKPVDYNNDGNFKYSVTVLIPKKDKKTVKAIYDALRAELKKSGMSQKAQDMAYKVATDISATNNFSILKDGDIQNEAREADEKKPYEHFKGMYTFKCSRRKNFDAPGVFKINPDTKIPDISIPIEDMGKYFENGTWVYLSFSCWANVKQKSINTTLAGVAYYRQAKGDEKFPAYNPFGDTEIEPPEEDELDLDSDESTGSNPFGEE